MLGTCTPTGEIDMASAPSFRLALRDTIDGSDEALVHVDCSGITFMGSAGYRALLDATEYAARRGRTLVIRDTSSSCARLIRVCAQSGDFTFESA
jgi:anti-anti-sigma factor